MSRAWRWIRFDRAAFWEVMDAAATQAAEPSLASLSYLRGKDYTTKMMFSTKAEYGVRVMAHLARREDDSPVSLGAIAEAEGLPLAYLEHLVQRLRRAGLVESRRGAHGGYSLARPAADVTMAEVVEALEGVIAPIECITASPDGALVCAREGDPGHDTCPTKLLWTRVQGSIVRTLRDLTLADLVQPYANSTTTKEKLTA